MPAGRLARLGATPAFHHGRLGVIARPIVVVAAIVGAGGARLAAHPAPFSYLDVHVGSDALTGRLVVHAIDVAHDLGIASPAALSDAATVERYRDLLTDLLAPRIRMHVDGLSIPWTVTAARPVREQDAIEIAWHAPVAATPGRLTLEVLAFPYDPNHQTFVNVYEGGALAWQEVFNAQRTRGDFYSGTRQGLMAVFQAFTASGIHHIAIGPDHILFIVGLLLLGGSLGRLLAIVTAFTLGHSLTLALATLRIVEPPTGLVEPAIALSIIYVGADNLLVGAKGRDVRAWVALAFGLVHGFGFANVLREIGLPDRALGVSLFAFNLGVEIGQAAIVIVVASALAFIRRRKPIVARRIVTAGSLTVMLAGAFWFVERTFQ